MRSLVAHKLARKILWPLCRAQEIRMKNRSHANHDSIAGVVFRPSAALRRTGYKLQGAKAVTHHAEDEPYVRNRLA